MEAGGRSDLAGRGVEVADPIPRDLLAGGRAEGEADLVGALELDLQAREHQVGRLRGKAVGDRDRFLPKRTS